MSNNIDNLFKKALHEQRCEPPARVWENIEKHLNRRRRLQAIWWYRSIAAVALLAVCVSIWQLSHQEQVSQTQEMAKSNCPVVKPAIPDVKQEISVFPEVALADNMNEKEKKSLRFSDVRKEIVPMDIRKTEYQATIKNKNLPVRIDKQVIRTDFIPLTSREAFKNNQQYQALLNEVQHEQKTKDKVKFALSGHFTPGYSSGNYSSSVKNTKGYSYSDDQMDGLMNAGGGLKLSISKGKRLSFQTGIFYSRMGQKTTENDEPVRTAAFVSPSSEKRVATPLGNIKSRRKAVAYRSTEAIVLNSIAANKEETFEQIFGAVEVPLYVRYKLNDNKMSFSVSGGFSGNFIVNNKVYLKTGSEKELLGSTEDIRNFNMSTDWSIGMEYPLSRKIKIMLEPGFKYYLQSLSRNADIDFKPYMFTLSTGIGIEF